MTDHDQHSDDDAEPEPGYDISTGTTTTNPPVPYNGAADWYEDWLRPTYLRDWSKRRKPWCPAWVEHAEVFERITALWLAWEQARMQVFSNADLSAYAAWWVQFCDPMMRELTALDGPFHTCSPEDHAATSELRRFPPA